jgi:hypothetical protein
MGGMNMGGMGPNGIPGQNMGMMGMNQFPKPSMPQVSVVSDLCVLYALCCVV